MAENSNIEWTHATFNPWRGCTKVSAGCTHCYAETMSGRNPSVLGIWGKRGTRAIAAESYWKHPIAWNRAATVAGERRRVFCASLADVFEGRDTMPASAHEAVDAARLRLWELIDATPMLDWLLLTKRPENILAMIPAAWRTTAPANVWYGTSTENQEQADKRIPELLKVPAVVRFLSAEPLLGPINLAQASPCGYYCDESVGHVDHDFLTPGIRPGIHWVIAGGESGHGARPMHPDWVRSLRDQCQTAGVAFHFKQWGEWQPANCLFPTADGSGNALTRVGKKNAGRLLDGREWSEFPQFITTEV